MDIKRLKKMIKKTSESGGAYTNPGQLGQYSATNQVSEGLLDKYLLSKGLQPKFISKDQKISHAKSNEYKKWAMNHRFEEVQLEDLTTDRKEGSDRKTDLQVSPTKKRERILTKAKKHYLIPRPPGSMKIKEEEQLDELSSATRTSYIAKNKQQQKELEPHTKGEYGDIAKRMLARRQSGEKLFNKKAEMSQVTKLTPEDVGDPKAAVNADGQPNPQLEPVSERKRQLTKSARMIKALYKKHNMKESLYDHEKEDKSVATYGKKPKHDKADPKDSTGEEKPQAAAVLSGGTTLTGQKRDTIEIDPIMRVRPGQPDPTKGKDKEKDKKKDEKK